MTEAPLDRLHPDVQRWIHAQGWSGLRPIQAAAIEPLLAGQCDVIVAAATAAGKTEAAFLPIASRLVAEPEDGVQALYVSPLKALINDQHRRLEEIAHGLGIDVHRWHGDVGAGPRARLVDAPRGVLLITPESLEAFFVLRGSALPRLFRPLAYVVIDELHAFLGTERGRQLQSLLARLESLLGRRVPRVGLSATLGDMTVAGEFLRPRGAADVHAIVEEGGDHEVRIAVRGYSESLDDAGLHATPEAATSAERRIAEHVFRHLRGATNLVFANSRRDVEVYAARLRERCEEAHVPNEFFPHHGSLASSLREEAETRLKDGSLPTTVVCTSTLELGIDVGDVASVAQLGAPPSVAALRQRLGRSGRRGTPSVLRVYVAEAPGHERAAPQDRLREELVQAVAAAELLLEGWCEPRASGALHLSTLVQQVLSVIAQKSGTSARALFELLCVEGPFEGIDEATFGALLRALGRRDLVTQDARGTLLTGLAGERLLDHHSFYAAFQTQEEFRVLHDGRALGTIPLAGTLTPGAGLVFAGRAWRIDSIDEERGTIHVRPGVGGSPPLFKSSWGLVHDAVRLRMRAVLEEGDEPAFCDPGARTLLTQARDAYLRLGLETSAVIEHERDALFFPWRGDRVLATLQLALVARGVETSRDGMALCVHRFEADELWASLADLEYDGIPDPLELARSVPAKARERYDAYLGDELLVKEFAARALDAEGAARALSDALRGAP